MAIEAQHPKACILAGCLPSLSRRFRFPGDQASGSRSIHVFHFNDYPADPPRQQATDADRVYPGDGVAPLDQLLRDLAGNGFRVTLSLELFNRKLLEPGPLIRRQDRT